MPAKRPFIMIDATDISLGAQFSFTQDHFDRICSDLSQVHLSRAVTASSAFPVAFTPLTLKNYPKADCGYTAPKWVSNALEDFDNAPSRYELARTWASYEDDSRHYIHLSDGGLSDNIGLRGPEVAITSSDSSWSLLNKVNNGIVKRLAVIVVDAKPQEPMSIDKSSIPPGTLTVLEAAATNPMENYSFDTVELLRDRFREWNNAASNFENRNRKAIADCRAFAVDLCASGASRSACEQKREQECDARFRQTENDRPPHPNLYRIQVSLDAIKDPALRDKLRQIPTTLELPDEDVELLINAAATLLDQSKDYRRLVRDLQADDAK